MTPMKHPSLRQFYWRYLQKNNGHKIPAFVLAQYGDNWLKIQEERILLSLARQFKTWAVPRHLLRQGPARRLPRVQIYDTVYCLVVPGTPIEKFIDHRRLSIPDQFLRYLPPLEEDPQGQQARAERRKPKSV